MFVGQSVPTKITASTQYTDFLDINCAFVHFIFTKNIIGYLHCLSWHIKDQFMHVIQGKIGWLVLNLVH